MKAQILSTMGLLILSIAHAGCGSAGGDSDSGSAGGDSDSGSATAGTVGVDGSARGGTGGATSGSKPSKSNTGGSAGHRTSPADGEQKDEPGEPTDDHRDPNGAQNGGGGAANPGSVGSAGAPHEVEDTPRADGDGDGIVDDRDLCPGTPSRVLVDATGCDATANTTQRVPWGQALPATAVRPTPTTGTVERNGFMNLVVGASSRAPISFRALATEVEELPNGFHVSGALLLDVPGDVITLSDADVTFEYGASKADGIRTLHGRARVPFPDFGAPENVELKSPIAEFGLEDGTNLADLKGPLVDDQRYLYFRFSDKLSAKVGAMTVELPAATEHTLVLDHTDPMFFVRASLTGVPGMPFEIKDAGVGFSRQGNLRFTPTHTWGLKPSGNATASPGFSGQMYLEMSGGVEIPETPIMLTGEAVHVIDLDPSRSGRTVFTDPANGLRLGANRALGIKLDLLSSAAIELEIAEASLDLSLLEKKKTASISGVVYPGKSFFNDVVPILPQSQLKMAAAIGSPLSDSRFALEGDVSIGLSKLSDLTRLSLHDLPLASSVLTIDKNGLSVHGRTGASFLQALSLGADATFDAVFAGDPRSSDWQVDLNGDLSVSGVHLSGTSTAHLDRSGVAVRGRLATKLGGIDLSGRIDESGVNLAGTARVSIPIVAGRSTLQDVVNGAACGFLQVTDGAKCGFQKLTGYAECGVNKVKACFWDHDCSTPTCDGAANTCSDYDHPKSCKQTVTIPDYDYGTFTATVDVKVGSNGLSASLGSPTCPMAGCQTSVDLSSSQVCVQVPGISQSLCAPF